MRIHPHKKKKRTKKEQENINNINNEIENKNPTLKPTITKKKTLKQEKEINNDLPSPKQSQGKNSQHKYSLKKVSNQNANNYYRVKFDKIMFFYYDFFKDMVVHVKQYEKISETDKKIQDSKQGPFNLDKLHEHFSNNKELDNHSKIESKIKVKRLEVRHGSKKKNSNNIFEGRKRSNHVDNEEEFKRKIKKALNKEDKQKSIEIFLLISTFIFAILIVLAVLYNYGIIIDINEDKQNIILICYSSKLRTIYNSVSYFLREFSIVNFLMPNKKNNLNYTQYPVYRNNRTAYLGFMREKFRNLYMQSNDILYLLTSFDVKLSENATNILTNNALIISTVNENLTLYDINTTFTISLVELNSALYNLAISNTFIQQNNSDLFIFIYNYQNEVGKGIRNQIDIFIEELNSHLKSKKLKFIIQMIIIFILLIMFFIILFICYKIIIKKKSSYIEGFYEIKLPFIRESIKNCEQFIYMLKKQKREEESGLEYNQSSGTLKDEENIEFEKKFEEEDEEKAFNTIKKMLIIHILKTKK